jgi:hypothetical protein
MQPFDVQRSLHVAWAKFNYDYQQLIHSGEKDAAVNESTVLRPA